MKIAILIFDKLTVLDAIGPYEVLCRLPGAEVVFVAPHKGQLRSDTGILSLNAEHSIDDVDQADVLLIGGGEGNRPLWSDERVLDWVRKIDQGSTWTTSVCTGSTVLAAAGLLDGRKATTHWAYFDDLRKLGAEPITQRVVKDGKYMMAAGVSSGIDMALTLVAEIAGDEVSKAIQLGIEYDPDPPFDSGSPAKADPALVELVRQYA
ncbi:DJ-1/PfpI family protein [soil metagenome]